MKITTLRKCLVAFFTLTLMQGGLFANNLPPRGDDCESETAFAFLNNDDDPSTADAESDCFIPQFNRWGWTTLLDFSDETGQSEYMLDIYAGAGQCVLSKGTDVGSVVITYNDDSTITVNYSLDGYVLSEAHIYVGHAPYPIGNSGGETVAPGQYTFVDSDIAELEDYTATIPVDGTSLYVIVHGVTKAADCLDDDCPDSDKDGICDNDDICPGFDDTADADGDGIPDGCDTDDDCPDSDKDGVCDADDICPGFDDTADGDGDGIPDGCDTDDDCPDSDGDGVCDEDDVCPGFDDTADSDGDGIPDGCDTGDDCPDSDGDGVCDEDDICPGFDDTADGDGDGIPDGCDTDNDCPDSDGDGVCDDDDICPGFDDNADGDGDGIPNGCETAFSPPSFTAYPVPFEDQVTIEYSFDYDTSVSIEVYDTKGIKLTQLSNGNYRKGTLGKSVINLSRVSDQLLFVRVSTLKSQFTKKIVSSK